MTSQFIKDIEIDMSRIPTHIAVIMDGNGRWAQSKGNNRVFGHQSAIKSVRETVECAAELGVKFLTLYAFSTENWKRPQSEVRALMNLLVLTLKKEKKTLQKNNVRLNAIGNIEQLPENCYKALRQVMQDTAQNDHMLLTLALSYGSRADIIAAIKGIIKDVLGGKLEIDSLDERKFSSYLSTAQMPEPELLIRTSGEYRISNFLLWEIAYTEIYITSTLWPDFRKIDLINAIADYQRRERRFGKTSDQIANQ